jgi:hypothetical protein
MSLFFCHPRRKPFSRYVALAYAAIGTPRSAAIRTYEVCSFWLCQKAKRRGKIYIGDTSIGYYSVWNRYRMSVAVASKSNCAVKAFS